MSDFKEYVCGFLFFKEVNGNYSHAIATQDYTVPDRVLLILKDRPVWQAGKYNGIGGKVEKDEKPFEAMVRECYEESGLTINDWRFYLTMLGPNYRIHFYKAFYHTLPLWEQKTSESLSSFPIHQLPENLINSNRYLIPMALEQDMVNATVTTE